MNMNNIRKIRERFRLPQSAFARVIGVTQGNISHYEHQRQEVPPSVARRIIEEGKKRSMHITFDDIYSVPLQQVPPPSAEPELLDPPDLMARLAQTASAWRAGDGPPEGEP
jgi:transcriptional regulator with XRE-family HTH domain